jgi:hypothetical protein
VGKAFLSVVTATPSTTLFATVQFLSLDPSLIRSFFPIRLSVDRRWSTGRSRRTIFAPVLFA